MQGVVSEVSAKPFGDKVLYSFQLQGDRTYYRVGERKPAVLAQGASIQFDAVPSANGKGVNAKNLTAWEGGGIVSGPAVSSVAPSRASTPYVNSKDKYWEDREARDIVTQKRIDLHARRNSAIAMAKLIVEAGALKLPKEQNAQAEVIEKLVAKYTEDFDIAKEPAHAETVSGEIGKEEATEVAEEDWN